MKCISKNRGPLTKVWEVVGTEAFLPKRHLDNTMYHEALLLGILLSVSLRSVFGPCHGILPTGPSPRKNNQNLFLVAALDSENTFGFSFSI